MWAKLNRSRRRRALAARGANIGPGLQSFSNFFGGEARGFKCGANVYVSEGAKLYVMRHHGAIPRLTLGDYVFINNYAIIDCHHAITIGNSVLIGPNCYIGDYDHGMDPTLNVGSQPDGKVAPVTLGDDVWLGANVIVLKGVSIGSGAIIGAGSVVTKDITPFSVSAGNPAKFIRGR